MQNFADRLETAIQRSGKPKGELAAHCGVALSTVSRWLAGTRPRTETLEMIAAYLQVESQWLVYGDSDLASDAKLCDDVVQYRVTPKTERAEPTMAEAFAKMGEALDMLKILMENMPKDKEP